MTHRNDAFTDDDLKRLKGFRHSDDGDCMGCVPCVDITALLARLEAAESIVNNMAHHYVPCAEVPCESCEQIMAWRKAAGRDGGGK